MMSPDEIRNFVDLVERLRAAQKDLEAAVKLHESRSLCLLLLAKSRKLGVMVDSMITQYYHNKLQHDFNVTQSNRTSS